MRFFIILFCILTSFPALAQISERLGRLNTMFEGNLTGAAYIKYCTKTDIYDHLGYVENAQNTMLSLAREMKIVDRYLKAADIQKKLQTRQIEIEQSLHRFYQKKSACRTSQARAAKKHFIMFNKKSAEEMKAFLLDIENR